MLKNYLKRVRLGLGYLPICGDCPGTGPFIILLLAGAGIGGWIGFVVSALIYTPMYIHGAYSRTVTEEKLSGEKLI